MNPFCFQPQYLDFKDKQIRRFFTWFSDLKVDIAEYKISNLFELYFPFQPQYPDFNFKDDRLKAEQIRTANWIGELTDNFHLTDKAKGNWNPFLLTCCILYPQLFRNRYQNILSLYWLRAISKAHNKRNTSNKTEHGSFQIKDIPMYLASQIFPANKNWKWWHAPQLYTYLINQ